MSSILVSHTYATGNYIPGDGEVVVVRRPQAHFGPGSTLSSDRDLASHDYHHAVVIHARASLIQSLLTLAVLPMPTYSAIDPISGLSSTKWLLSQPADYQNLHIPVPHEHTPPVTQPHPPFPTPAQFGDPIEFGGWKDCRPCWIQAVPRLIRLTFTTEFQCYEPPVEINEDDVDRLKVFCGLSPSPVLPDSTGRSSAWQALYANEAVKEAFAIHWFCDLPALILYDDDDDDDDVGDHVNDDDDDDSSEDMDIIAYGRLYAAHDPHFAKIVQDHDDKMRERLVERITDWMNGIDR